MILNFLAQVIERHPDQFAFREAWNHGEHLPFDLLCGGNKARECLVGKIPISELVAEWERDLDLFAAQRARYMFYEE
jgi:hypothetical protein